MYTFADLQSEVKRRATRDQSGTTYDTAIKNTINYSLFRIARESPWRGMRRVDTLKTVTSYTTGSDTCAVLNASATVTITGATLLTDNVKVNRYIKIDTSSDFYKIKSIISNTVLNLDRVYDGTTASTTDFEILPQGEYNLPPQVSHRMFLWHNEYGYPYKMNYIPDQEFYGMGLNETETGVPTHYRMWGEDMVKQQPHSPKPMVIYSSNAADTSISVTVFGTVASYPDYEIITTNGANGTVTVTGSKVFESVERVVKNASTTGRMTVVTSDTSLVIATLPTGDTTGGILYKKIQLYPLPDSVFNINVHYYKDPYRLVNDGDIHELGQEFDEAIILLSIAKIKAETSQTEATNFYALYQDELRTLRRTNMDKIDYFPKLQRRDVGGEDMAHPFLSYRQVGAYYGRRTRG